MTASPSRAPESRQGFSDVTETVGEPLRRGVLEMMWARYLFGADLGAGKDVLEVACGSGAGLGILARRARRVVGGDFTFSLVQLAARHYGPSVPLCCLDAQALPFKDASFDVVLCFEAMYYFPDADSFCREVARVLREGGRLLIAQVNPRWHGFSPTVRSSYYHTARELAELLERHSFQPEILVGFPDRAAPLRSRLVRGLRRLAVALHLVPRLNVRQKRLLRRMFYGRLTPLPPEFKGTPPQLAPPEQRVGDERDYVVLYAIGRRALALETRPPATSATALHR